MNTSVTVTGMQVTTKVSSNLMIAELNDSDDRYSDSLTQSVSGALEPASTVDGVSFFYVNGSNVKADGDAKTNTYIAYNESNTPTADSDSETAVTNAKKTKYDGAFNTAYSNTVADSSTLVYFGYVDYVFYVKATNVELSAQQIKMTKCNLLYNGGALGANDLSWRVAVFSVATAKETETAVPVNTTNLKSILKRSGAQNFETGKAVSSTSATGTLNAAADAAANIGELASGATGYFKVDVRLWLEGEDNKCTNETYALLTNAYTLDLELKLDPAESPVTNIASVVPAP